MPQLSSSNNIFPCTKYSCTACIRNSWIQRILQNAAIALVLEHLFNFCFSLHKSCQRSFFISFHTSTFSAEQLEGCDRVVWISAVARMRGCIGSFQLLPKQLVTSSLSSSHRPCQCWAFYCGFLLSACFNTNTFTPNHGRNALEIFFAIATKSTPRTKSLSV